MQAKGNSSGNPSPASRKPVAASAASMAAVSEKYPGRIKPRAYAQEEAAGKASWVKVAMLAIVGLLLLGGISAYMMHTSNSGLPGPLAGPDEEILSFANDNTPVEVRYWLEQDPSRMLGGLSASQAKAFIDKLYKLGAVKIYAFGSRMSIALVMELPTNNPQQRKAIFDWRASYSGAGFEIPPTDVGQRYMLVRVKL